GGMGGARSAFIVYPDRRLAIVVLTNLVGANPQNFIPRIATFYGARAPVPALSRAA
ncbi:MAG TPA: serine hydrolase, partial [Stenotrophomonas sp.]|nr:serine hydrolase [Stenotrophomonas sp.]